MRRSLLYPSVSASALAILLSTLPSPAQASTNSNRVDIGLTAVVPNTLALVIVSTGVVFGNVTSGLVNLAPVTQNVAITSTWVLNAGQTVKLYAYFDSATAAMTGTLLGDTVPSSAITGSLNSGASQTFTQSSPFSAASTAATLYTVAITSSNAITAARLDSLALSLNLTGLSLHADTYTGTMHIQAQAL